ncbi:polysaccharide biosynthesis protein, partial [Candidatus Peregrinibacteria bacterium]|nr:polysaccharide biosynthesis protein [Candidatus Peregrinibacteria bacterium]
GVRFSTDVRMEELFLWIGAAGAVLLFLLSLFPAHRLLPVRFCFDRTLITYVLLLAAPYGVAYLGMAFYRQLDVVFISLLRSDFAIQNAYYGFAGRVEDMAFLVPTLLLNSTLPILTARLAEKQDVRGLLGKTLLLLLILGSIFFLFSFLWSRPLTLLFTTPAYLSTPDHPGSDTAFRLMALPMFLNGLVLYCFYVFLALHQWRRLILSFSVGVILSVVLNLLLTPLYGFVGAATALIVVHIFLVFLLLPPALRALKPALLSGAVLRWMLFTFILGACLTVTAPFISSASLTAISGTFAIVLMAGLLWVTGLYRSFSS